MSALVGHYFDGRRALRHVVEVALEAGRVRLLGPEVRAEYDARAVRASPRIANTPRWLYLPDGATVVLNDGASLDDLHKHEGFPKALHALESRPAYAVIAVALVVAVLWLLLDRGVPAAVSRIVDYVPVETEATLGNETLQALDRYLMRPSNLPVSRQSALRERFYEIVHTEGDAPEYRVLFRSSPVLGPNAFALPSGIIVMTDELVHLAQKDDEIVGVLAHELGHVKRRHAMRSLLEGSITALVIAGVTGDIASATSLAAAAPAVLLQNKYSRNNELEADRYAIDLMRRGGIDPRDFAALLTRMEKADAPKGAGIPPFLSSHPTTAEREALAREAAGTKPNRE